MNPAARLFSRLFTPSLFRKLCHMLTQIFWPSLVLWIGSLIWGAFFTPPDVVQGHVARLLYLHVPAAWGAITLYFLLGIIALSFLVAKLPLSLLLAQSVAEFGTILTATCLVTGALWGKPTWGTYWVWDARLTSMAILFLLYISYLMVRHQEKTPTGATVASLLAVMGLLNLPVIKYSVTLWATLHQPPSLTYQSSNLPPEMLFPLLACTLSLAFLTLGIIGKRCESLFHTKLQEMAL